MNTDVSTWNPFKFLRKTPDEKRAEPASSSGMAATANNLPSAWFASPRFLLADPFRMMQELLLDPVGGVGKGDRWFGDFSPSIFEPRIDVIDDDDALRVSAELPGMERQDLEILVENKTLLLSGEKKLESKSNEKGCYRTERAFGRFQRAIPLPDGIDLEHAEATFDKGVLTIRIPKSAATEKSSAQKIEIK
ncbi:MAG: Hsp20/alpha crystallin family protein [Burkholderiales bacterium]|jgi:HSP20 family protein